LSVLHKCDNPPCCNPAHLWLGTYADNNNDRARKGRSVIRAGEKSGMAKLTWAKVHQIRALYRPGKVTYRALGRQFGVHHTVIMDVVHNISWKEEAGTP